MIPPLFWWALWAREQADAALVAAQGLGAWLAALSVEARETARAWLLERAVVRAEPDPSCEICSGLAPQAPGCGYCGQPGMTPAPRRMAKMGDARCLGFGSDGDGCALRPHHRGACVSLAAALDSDEAFDDEVVHVVPPDPADLDAERAPFRYSLSYCAVCLRGRLDEPAADCSNPRWHLSDDEAIERVAALGRPL